MKNESTATLILFSPRCNKILDVIIIIIVVVNADSVIFAFFLKEFIPKNK